MVYISTFWRQNSIKKNLVIYYFWKIINVKFMDKKSSLPLYIELTYFDLLSNQ